MNKETNDKLSLLVCQCNSYEDSVETYSAINKTFAEDGKSTLNLIKQVPLLANDPQMLVRSIHFFYGIKVGPLDTISFRYADSLSSKMALMGNHKCYVDYLLGKLRQWGSFFSSVADVNNSGDLLYLTTLDDFRMYANTVVKGKVDILTDLLSLCIKCQPPFEDNEELLEELEEKYGGK